KSAPDGYTLLYGNTGEMGINPHLMKDMGFDPLADFVPVVLIHNVPLGLIVSSQSPYTSFGNFLDAARREPGKLSFASSGNGMPGFGVSLWGGFFAPAGTPGEIVSRVNREVLGVLTQPDVTAKMAEQGSDVVRTTPQEFGRFVQNELKKYGEIIKGSGLKLQ